MQHATENPLWTFSLVVYAKPGVQEECLALQERHALDVNLLLLCAYAGISGVTLSDHEVAAAARAVVAWHREVVRALRSARRALKRVAREDATALRVDVKAAELASERIEQDMLWDWWRGAEKTTLSARDPLGTNIRRLLAHYGVHDADPAQAAPSLLRAAARYATKT